VSENFGGIMEFTMFRALSPTWCIKNRVQTSFFVLSSFPGVSNDFSARRSKTGDFGHNWMFFVYIFQFYGVLLFVWGALGL